MLKAIVLSIVLVSGIPWGSYLGYNMYKRHLENDNKYILKAIVTKPEGYNILPSAFFSEKLGLAIDKPINLYSFPLKQGEERLMAFHVFKKVKISRIPPSSLLIEYELRNPQFLLATLSNTAIDQEGALFPYYPFFTPKKLPELRLNGDIKWGDKVDISIPLKLIEALPNVKAIDLSKMDLDSLGEREVILKWGKGYVRLKSEYLDNIKYLKEPPVKKELIDARIAKQLIIKELE